MIGLVHGRNRLAAQSVVAAAPDNADDLVAIVVGGTEAEPASERILVWKEPLRKELIDDDDLRGSTDIALF